MLKIFGRYVLGGASNKREGAWFIFLLITALVMYAVRKEAIGVDMPQTWAFLVIAWPAALAGVIGVHAQHFHAEARNAKNDGVSVEFRRDENAERAG